MDHRAVLSSVVVLCVLLQLSTSEPPNRFKLRPQPKQEQQKAEFVKQIVERNEYSRRIPPVMLDKRSGRDDYQTPVYIWNIRPRSLIDIDEKAETMVMSVTFGVMWMDCSLRWNGSEHEYITVLRDDIWKPDFVITNSASDGIKRDEFGHKEQMMYVFSTGLVLWEPSIVISSQCDMIITYFPFDYQKCDIILGTTESKYKQYNIHWSELFAHWDTDLEHRHSAISLDKYDDDGTWKMMQAKAYNLRADSDQNRIKYTFVWKRKNLFYIMTFVIPVLMLSITAGLVFLIPPSAGDKISTSITVVLSYAVYLTIMSDYLPEISTQMSLLGLYLTIQLGYTTLVMCVSVCILRIYAMPEQVPITDGYRKITITLAWLSRRQDILHGTSHESLTMEESEEALGPDAKGAEGEDSVADQLTWEKIAMVLDWSGFLFFTALTTLTTVVMMIALGVGAVGDHPELPTFNVTDDMSFHKYMTNNLTCPQ